MLKITYLESELRLEHLSISVEAWLARRSYLAARSGGTLILRPSYASLLLFQDLPRLPRFLEELGRMAVDVDICDRTHLEITLYGTWVSEHAASDSGVFLTSLPHPTEQQLLHFWQLSQAGVSVGSAQASI